MSQSEQATTNSPLPNFSTGGAEHGFLEFAALQQPRQMRFLLYSFEHPYTRATDIHCYDGSPMSMVQV
jgi:hypothetical protein